VATTTTMDRPFRSVGDRPLVCPFPHGAIDATTYREGGRLYLLWKVDGNCCSAPTPIYLRELTADGLRFRSTAKTRLIDWSEAWEHRVVEAPTLRKANGRYWLFYSASHWDRAADGSPSTYVTAYAASDKLEGPYQKGGRLLGQSVDGRGLDGPGGQDFITGPDGRSWFAYHAWSPGGRSLHFDFLEWEQGRPVIIPRCAP
jgi:arabinan endo-1,5-alpha-L-arabinosidase